MKDEKSPPFGTKSKKKKEPPHTQRGGSLFIISPSLFFSSSFPFHYCYYWSRFYGEEKERQREKEAFF